MPVVSAGPAIDGNAAHRRRPTQETPSAPHQGRGAGWGAGQAWRT
jgi:hypothetical protein